MNIRSRYGIPAIDLDALHRSRSAYNAAALTKMKEWIKGKFLVGSKESAAGEVAVSALDKATEGDKLSDSTTEAPVAVQYEEVKGKLEEFGTLPYCYEGFFCRRILLPQLLSPKKESLPVEGRIDPEALDPAILAILYSIDTQGHDRLLVRQPAIVDNQNLVFEVDLEVQSMKLRKYVEVLNYLNPQQAELKWIKTEMREDNAAVLGDAGQQKDRDNGLQIMPV